ncbi:hypothetical protein [Nucisporomicrobium flavum]|uniref:hypothetical protein n=1 Tax=Nucisporomicrobium flavum TaxID=2785915 RepID=UPI0018F3E418|nr:hypothetical protein [Nucisporomicrobium flavum]
MPDGDDVTIPPAPPAGLPTRAVPFVPAPRVPHPWDSLPPGFPSPVLPEPRRALGKGLLFGGSLALIVALFLGAGAVYVANRDPLDSRAEAAAEDRPKLPLTPFEQVNAALKTQAEALLRGDEKAWLAAVDPGRRKLRDRYRAMYRSLRLLGVSHFDYRTYVRDVRPDKSGSLKIGADVAYCLAGDTCVKEKSTVSDGPPSVALELTVKHGKGGWLITSLAPRKPTADKYRAPWASGELVTTAGKRVTLIGAPSEKKYFRRLLPIAEHAAVVNDRFAALVGNPQQRYRIYVAGAKQWKSWYGGIRDKWIVAYAFPRNEAGTDVVLNMAELKDDREFLATTVQHELGHVVTVGNLHRRTWVESDMWLKEGIAEYIGWYPRPATASWRRPAVRNLVNGSGRPKSIAVDPLKAQARLRDGDAFYGFGHFSADCMAKKYGQRALFTFVRLHLREDRDLDSASGEAFGKPFAAVDKACVAYIRDRA